MIVSRFSRSIFRSNVVGNRFLEKVLHKKLWPRNFCVVAPAASAKIEHIYKSPYSDIVVPNLSILEYLRAKSELQQDRVALVCGETGEEHRYGELWERVERVASAFARRGISKGTTVALVIPNCPEFAIAFLAAAATGATITTVNSHFMAGEMIRQLQDSEATALVYHPAMEGTVQEAVRVCGDKIRLLISTGPTNMKDSVTLQSLYSDDGLSYPVNVEVDPLSDVLVLPYSSGTTGLPKGVMLTHANILANIEQMLHPDLMQLQDPNHMEVMFAVIPLFHIYGMVALLFLSLASGSKCITFAKFDPQLFVMSIVQYKPTILHTVPPILNFLASTPQVLPEYLRSVQMLVCGAAPLGETLVRLVTQKFNHGLVFQEGFGMTELSPVSHMTHRDSYVAGSCGQLVPNTEAKVVHLNTGVTLASGEGKGELLIRGPQVMKGYFKNPSATAETIDADGWLHTGDVARVDAEGNTFIVDRVKELIKVKGFQVAPAELEDLLRSCPGVADAAVVGIPDDKAGELPRAYIVKDPKERSVTAEQLQQFVATKVSEHKQLTGGVVFLDAIPKSMTGKILRKDLKAQALEQ